MRRPLVPLLFSLVLLAGCGAGGSEPEALTAAEWRRQANAVCLEIGRKVQRVPEPSSEDRITSFTAAVIPLWKREEDRIRAMAAPPELAPQAAGLADALAEINVSLLEIHIATQRQDGVRRFYAVKRYETAGRGVKLRSRDLGLPACARQRVP